MDSIRVSEAPDTGSIPVEATMNLLFLLITSFLQVEIFNGVQEGVQLRYHGCKTNKRSLTFQMSNFKDLADLFGGEDGGESL